MKEKSYVTELNMRRSRQREAGFEAPSISVLLAGRERELVSPMLSSLADAGRMTLLRQNGTNDQAAADLVVASPVYWPSLTAARGRAKDSHRQEPPVLLCLSAESLEGEELYEAASDFVVVPCAAAELAKRIERLALRRHPQAPVATRVIRVGEIALDTETYQVTVEDRAIPLAWTEFRLLRFLMENPGRIFKRGDLLNRVWGVEYLGGARTVDVHIRRLRHKLGPDGELYLRTVRNVGYGLEAP